MSNEPGFIGAHALQCIALGLPNRRGTPHQPCAQPLPSRPLVRAERSPDPTSSSCPSPLPVHPRSYAARASPGQASRVPGSPASDLPAPPYPAPFPDRRHAPPPHRGGPRNAGVNVV